MRREKRREGKEKRGDLLLRKWKWEGGGG